MLFNLELFLVHLAAVASPGPDNLLVITYSQGKFKKSLKIASGLSLGIALYTAMTLTGIDKFFLEYPSLLTALQFLGAGYLAFLANSVFKSSFQSAQTAAVKADDEALFLKAFFTFVTNPKAFLYFFSVLPSFLPDSASDSDLLSIWVTVIVTSFIWFFSLGLILGVSKKILVIQNHPYYLRTVSFLFAGLSASILISLF